ncbi:hypothetical protein [Bradyrhizobium sp. 141]|uniref:hypothetical protein n=1 Tax=Bradyrhizobium sp. 141 TaxID=2782617 RepID=UPI001FF8B6E2|nr:hypothetical protein [Bradyrhizobium sp. 141]MCK1719911.1 hypothetical protein [Bradyrhizobium sp. 141]
MRLEKAWLSVRVLEQLMTLSGDRNPHGWSASVASYALLPHQEFAVRPRDRSGLLAHETQAKRD